MTVRVLLAEDQAMVRWALAALLALEGDIEVVAEVARGDEVLPAALAARPDVALLDIEMPGGDGLAAAAALKERLPACRALILTTFGRTGYLRRARGAGGMRRAGRPSGAGRRRPERARQPTDGPGARRARRLGRRRDYPRRRGEAV